MDRDQFIALVNQAEKAARSYYSDAGLVMADAEYDALIDQIEAAVISSSDPEFEALAHGVLHSVAAGQGSGGEVVHEVPMLSLQKATKPAELTAFLKRIGNVPVTVEPKLDGISLCVRYASDGTLSLLASRGDGQTGEDLTAKAGLFPGIPRRIAVTEAVEFRGEAYMTTSQFEAASSSRVANGGDAFSNARNATAGVLNAKELGYEASLSFAVFDVLGPAVDRLGFHHERLERAENLGFSTACDLIPSLPKDAEEAISAIEEVRPSLDFQIDGAVVKVDEVAERASLGEISRSPRWALAWKYAAEEATSFLRGVEVTVGRTGRVAFTGLVDPVVIGGVSIERATLHNADFIAEQQVGIGSKVLVSRANDVIPRITGLPNAEENEGIEVYVPSSVCPSCGSEFDTGSKIWHCHSAECSVVGSIAYFAGRECMDIDGLGETIVEDLVDQGVISDAADLYDLSEGSLREFVNSDGRVLGDNGSNIYRSIQGSKGQPFHRVLTGLGIRMTGRRVSKLLAEEFGSMDALLAASVDDLSAVDGLGVKKATSIVTGLADRLDLIERLRDAGLQLSAEQASEGPLTGMVFVISGSVDGYTRTTASEAIEAAGGKTSSAVSANTTGLITDDTSTSKGKKAEKLGVRVIPTGDFEALLSGSLL
jgi:DNA ligase (NAD+)